MAIISDCEFCNWVSNTPNATYTKQTEFYDGIDGLENIQMCWRCGEAAKFEQERIIKLLKELGDGCDCDECGSNNDLGHYWFEVELIKGEK